MSRSAPFTVNKLSESGAAEVLNFKWPSVGDPAVLDALKAALWKNPILAIRDANLTANQLAEFSRLFGPLDPNDPRRELTHPDDKDVLILSNEIRGDGTAVGVVDAGEEWHSDLSFRPTPALATILQLVQRPSRGGDTEYCNLYLVYESLPDALKRRVAGLNALHHVSKLRNPRVVISENRPSATEYY